ncbi:MAG: hypothetical protein AAF561_08430 [Planctomycetota bacterium]
MQRIVCVVLGCLVVAGFGCVGKRSTEPSFGPSAIELSQTFSRVVDDQLQVDVELLDGFGDSVKGSGVLTLQLFEYEPDIPEVRGRQVMSPRRYDLGEPDVQRQLWRRVSRTYYVEINVTGLRADRTYLLQATYAAKPGTTTRPGEVEGQLRFFDDATLKPRGSD